MQAIQCDYSAIPTSNSFQTYLYCVYLFQLYDKSIIILLTNDLTNMVEMNLLCIVDHDHQRWVIVEDHTSKFKTI